MPITTRAGKGSELTHAELDQNFIELAAAMDSNAKIAASVKSTNYTLGMADAGTMIEMNAAGANTVTVPPSSSVPFPNGSLVNVCQVGAGATTIVAGAGVTLQGPSSLALRGRWATVNLRKRSGNEWVLTGDFADAQTPGPVGPEARIALLGVNLSGAEHDTSVEPGVYPTNYQYPATADAAYWVAKGVTCIRLPFRWKRIQPTRNAALDEAEVTRLKTVVDYLTGQGVSVVVDMHNYGRYEAGGALIGSAELPNADFADGWGRIAARFATNPKVIWGLMNEPAQTDGAAWIASQNAAIAAIRATGAAQLVLVSAAGGGNFTGTLVNRDAFAGVVDSSSNWAIEVHRYFDTQANGTQTTVTHIWRMVEALPSMTAWARRSGYKLFYGEFGSGNNADAADCMRRGFAYLQNNRDIWIGATLWGGGKRLGTGNPLYLEPANGVDKLIAVQMFRYLTGGDLINKALDVDGQPGTADANVAYAAGRFGQARSAGIITTSSWATYKMDELTVEAWVRLDTAPAAITWAVGAQINIGTNTNGTARAAFGSANISTTVSLLDGNWHYLSLSGGPSGATFFVDGVAAGSTATPFRTAVGATPGQFPVIIGANVAGSANIWPGLVDEVVTFRSILRTGDFTPPTARWTGNEPNLLSLHRLDGDISLILGTAA